MTVVGMVYDRIRWEEKALIKAARDKAIKSRIVDSREIYLHLDRREDAEETFGNIVIQRCVSYFRGLHITSILENSSLQVINPFQVSLTCGNKMFTTLALTKAGVPVPENIVAFDPESALKGFEEIGYPAVLKPVVGSWGRLVALVKDRESAKALIETRHEIRNALLQIFYIQKFVEGPPRDIRIIVIGDDVVGATYRYSPKDDWRTNVSRGGTSQPCPITEELQKLALKTSQAVGGGVLAVDCMETSDGFVVNEINGTPEFRGLTLATNIDVAAKIIKYVIEMAKK